jgi:predicted MFS family arabinose efflux permease
LPNIGIVISRWFPAAGRAQAMGVVCMAMQAGAFLAPFLVVPMQQKWGWQSSFFAFGAVGILWSIAWYLLYRDELGPEPKAQAPHSLDLKVFRDPNVLASLYIGFCYVFGLSWFIFWMPTFLVKGRAFTETQLLWTSIPPIAGALANLAGGWASDRAVRAWGLTKGRKSMGLLGLIVATLFMLAVAGSNNPVATIAFLAASYVGIAFQQTVLFTTVVDMGGANVGAMVGAVNMAATLGGLVCSVSFGYFVEGFGSYTLALLPMCAILASGAIAWSKLRLSGTS